MVGEDPLVLLEGWLRRVLAFDLVLLPLLLVAGPAARVGIRGAAHGFDAIQFAPRRRRRVRRNLERREAATGRSRTQTDTGQEGDEDQPTVIIPGNGPSFLLGRGEAQMQLPRKRRGQKNAPYKKQGCGYAALRLG